MSSSIYRDEDIDSESSAVISVRNSVVNTMNAVQISHERESFRKSRDSLHSPHHQDESSSDNNSEEESSSDEDASNESYSISYQQQNSAHKYEINHVEGNNSRSEIDDSPSDSDNNADNQDVMEVNEPLQLVKISDDLSTFEV